MLINNKKIRKFFVAVTIFSMVAMYGAVPLVRAASLTNASDTLSDSNVSVSATHTATFTTGVVIASSSYMEVVIPSGFGTFAAPAITCPTNSTASVPVARTARCTASASIATGTQTITITGVTNPSTTGSQTISITTYNSGGTQLETIDVMVAIIDTVTVSATVNATLTFTVQGLATSTSVNGSTTTGSSTDTALAYGALTVGTPSVLGQRLSVTTNAGSGYSVTVEQDGNLVSGSGADIDSFKDGTASTTAVAWTAPTATLGSEATYGHFGFTSEDASLSDGDHFGATLYQGFNGTTPVEVMYHTGPADGSTADIGQTDVGYEVEISALQEAGDYTNTLTYIATPIY